MLRRILICLLGFLCTAPSWAGDIVVVANPKSSMTRLTQHEVLDIYMGRNRKLVSGEVIVPLDLPQAVPECERFYARLTGKRLSEIRAYWARLLFTGRAAPPFEVESGEAVLKRIAEDRNAIAYIDRSMLTPQVRVVYEFNEN